MSHWYTQEGLPLYEVPKADGSGMRDTTLRDAKKLGLVTSSSTVIKIPSNYFLDKWKKEQVLKAAMELPRSKCKTDDEWVARVLEKSDEISKTTRENGDLIHKALEKMLITGETEKGELGAYCDTVNNILIKEFGNVLWTCERSFAHPLGFGGRVDLTNNIDVVLDFKTKNSADFDKLLVYDEHGMQLASYREGLRLPKAECYNLFISTTEPGLVKLVKWSENELNRCWKMFKHLLSYWQLSNNHMVQDE